MGGGRDGQMGWERRHMERFWDGFQVFIRSAAEETVTCVSVWFERQKTFAKEVNMTRLKCAGGARCGTCVSILHKMNKTRTYWLGMSSAQVRWWTRRCLCWRWRPGRRSTRCSLSGRRRCKSSWPRRSTSPVSREQRGEPCWASGLISYISPFYLTSLLLWWYKVHKKNKWAKKLTKLPNLTGL